MNPFKQLDGIFDDGGDSDVEALDDVYFICERNSSYEGNLKLQGLVALTDATEKDGGFLTVPGFSSNFEQWSKYHQNSEMGAKMSKTSDFVFVPQEDPLINQARPVPVRAGSVSLISYISHF
jgi:ectoine hydroxylase-related dioxygenase (phytanoyl-CoA dioxygenase family)